MSAQLQQEPNLESSAAATATRNADPPQPQQRPGETVSTMSNATASSPSPYVRAQSSSNVAWQLFSHDAVSRAKAENKLIFLHIGYSASHHCYLMIQESFPNRHIVETLNEHFIPIFVDREERPDVDNIYMSYLATLNSKEGYPVGHPVNVFLTPELEPVHGGTYEEPSDFLAVLLKAQENWESQEDLMREEGKRNVVELRKYADEGMLGINPNDASADSVPDTGEVDLDQVEEAYSRISETFDRTFGGFIHVPAGVRPNFQSGRIDPERLAEVYEKVKNTPKFPAPAKLSFLLRSRCFPPEVQDIVGHDLAVSVSDFAVLTLQHIVFSGIHDQIGAGFHRCATNRRWSLPSFEKMLPDNALLLGVFLDAWLLENKFEDIVHELADYLTRSPVMLEQGGFTTSEAADSCSKRGTNVLRQGGYYIYTRKEFDTIIGNEQEAQVAALYWGLDEHGNVEREQDPNDEYINQNVLRVAQPAAAVAKQCTVPEDEVVRIIKSVRAKLKAHRESDRARPAVDAKVITAYNGMAIASLARTSAACKAKGQEERAATYLDAAIKAANFIKKELWSPTHKMLYRFHCDGTRADTEAFAEDYAFLIEGLIELYEVTSDDSWLQFADELQGLQNLHFYDHNHESNARVGAFYSTTKAAPHVLLRIKDAMDGSQPSINAVSAFNLFRLGALLDDDGYTTLARNTVYAFEPELLEYPYLFPGLLSGIVNCRLAERLAERRWVSVGESESKNKGLSRYQSSPRGGLWTLLHDPSASVFLKQRSPQLVHKLSAKQPGLYYVKDKELHEVP